LKFTKIKISLYFEIVYIKFEFLEILNFECFTLEKTKEKTKEEKKRKKKKYLLLGLSRGAAHEQRCVRSAIPHARER
jgi:hypothetical protein